jgi:nuclear transport factor 2 (NTF2) superfamily protein
MMHAWPSVTSFHVEVVAQTVRPVENGTNKRKGRRSALCHQ